MLRRSKRLRADETILSDSQPTQDGSTSQSPRTRAKQRSTRQDRQGSPSSRQPPPMHARAGSAVGTATRQLRGSTTPSPASQQPDPRSSIHNSAATSQGQPGPSHSSPAAEGPSAAGPSNPTTTSAAAHHSTGLRGTGTAQPAQQQAHAAAGATSCARRTSRTGTARSRNRHRSSAAAEPATTSQPHTQPDTQRTTTHQQTTTAPTPPHPTPHPSHPTPHTSPQPPSHPSPSTQALADQPLHMLVDDPTMLLDPWCISPEMLATSRTGDLLLVCKDNKAVQCHSQVLAFCCDILRDMLDSTQACRGSSADRPARIHLADDLAEHWLYALMWVYPNVPQPPPPGQLTAVALALLGHKYNITRMTSVWDTFVAQVKDKDLSIGHFTWAIPNWSETRKLTSFFLEEFNVGGNVWTLHLHSDGPAYGTTSHVTMAIHPSNQATDNPLVCFSIRVALVNHVDPSRSHVMRQENIQPKQQRRARCCLEVAALNEEGGGFVNEDMVEVQVLVEVSQLPGAPPSPFTLSGLPDHPMYVFKWLNLAETVHCTELRRKCHSFVARNAFYALFEPQFRQDRHAALVALGPEHSLRLLGDVGYL